MRIKNWFSKHLWAISAAYFVCYLIAFFAFEKFIVPTYMIHAALDDKIPFCEWFIFPYFAWFPLIACSLIYFLRHSKKDYLRLCFLMYTGMTICLLIYLCFPNGLDLRVELTRDNWPSKLVGALQAMDTPTNVCPSIHVLVTVVIDMVVLHSKELSGKTGVKAGVTVLAVLICLSTVFLKQHSVIDVFWGLVLAFVLRGLQCLWERKKETDRKPA